MKKVRFIVCAVMALVLFSCEKAPKETLESDWVKSLPESVAWDLRKRYPDAKIIATDDWSTGRYAIRSVSFVDKDGFENEVLYRNGRWYYSEKRYNVDDFISQLPKRVLLTYLGLGFRNERFTGDEYHDDYHVVEIEREGLAQKQYEIYCVATGLGDRRVIDDLLCHIVISEDGTLLSNKHVRFCPTDQTYDMDKCFEVVHELYGDVKILGAIREENKRDNYVFIYDKGTVKTVELQLVWGEGYEWQETRYRLSPYSSIPDYVRTVIENQLSGNPDDGLFAINIVETTEGLFYELCFGDEWGYFTNTIKSR